MLLQVLGGLTILLGLLFAGVFGRFPLAGRMLRPSLLVIVGVLQVSGAWGAAMTWLKVHWVSGYQPPL